MPDEAPTIASLVERCRAGDDEAARQLFEYYAEQLLQIARWRINARLASRIDAEDVVQSVFRTFFGRLRTGHFHLQDKDDVCKLLVRITLHKTLKQISFHTAEKRDHRQESTQKEGEDAPQPLSELLAREPGPEVVAAFMDQMEFFFTRIGPQERQILELRMSGFTNEEIAEKLGIYDRKIRRLIERIRGLAAQAGLCPF